MNYLDALTTEYEVKERLSEGAHGETYRVMRGNFHYAAKIYGGNAEAECEHERDIYRHLNEKNAKEQFFQADRVNGAPVLIMETYEGSTLAEYFKTPAFKGKSWGDKLRLLIKACSAVSYMHEAGVLHLDVKPSNLYISDNENSIKPIDMGSAVFINREYNSLSELFRAVGYRSTTKYASARLRLFNRNLGVDEEEFLPEEKDKIIALEKSISVQDDIYSLICLIYKALTGRDYKDWLCNTASNYYDNAAEIKKALCRAGTPEYLVEPLVELFMTLDAPSRYPDANVPFESVGSLIEQLQILSRVADNFGCDALVLLRNMKASFEPRGVDSTLLCRVIDNDGNRYANLAEYYSGTPKKSIYLVCDGGAGKTYQLSHLCEKVLSDGRFIPLYINANQYDNSANFIKDYIFKRYVYSGVTDYTALLTAFKQDKPILLLVDGVNETSYSPIKLHRELSELCRAENVYTIVTDRTVAMKDDGFAVFGLEGLEQEFTRAAIPDFDELNDGVKALVRIPFYFKYYTDLPISERGNITCATDLLEKYYEQLLKKQDSSLEGEDYHRYCKALLNDFLPLFAYKQSRRASALIFSDEDCSALWSGIKARRDISLGKACVHALCDLGIAEKQGEELYAFAHQNTYTYFAAKYIYECDDDALIEQVNDEHILKMLGEMFGDISARLDKYREPLPLNSSAGIVAKYVDMLTLCGKTRNQDLSRLNLSLVSLHGKDWRGTTFAGSCFDHHFIDTPVLDNPLCFAYTDGNFVVVSDLLSRVLVFDMNLNIKKILEPRHRSGFYLMITASQVHMLETVFPENPFAQPDYKATEWHTRLELSNMTVECFVENDPTEVLVSITRDSEIGIIADGTAHLLGENCFRTASGIAKKEEEGSVSTFYIKGKKCNLSCTRWNVMTEDDRGVPISAVSTDNILRVRTSIDYSTEGFDFSCDDDSYTYSGDLLVRTSLSGRVYDTAARKCRYLEKELRHYGFGSVYGYLDGGWKTIGKLHNNIKDLEFSPPHIVVKDYYTDEALTAVKNIPLDGPFAAGFFDKGIFFYNNQQVVLYDTKTESFTTLPLWIDGDILFEGVKFFGEQVYILYSTREFPSGKVHLIHYDIQDHTFSNVDTGINHHSDLILKEMRLSDFHLHNSRVAMTAAGIYIAESAVLYGYFPALNWHFFLSVSTLDIGNINKLVPLDGNSVLVHHDGDRISKLTIKILDESLIISGNMGESKLNAAVGDRVDIYPIIEEHLYDERVVYSADEPCMQIKRDFTVKYLEGTDIRGCDFEGAKIMPEGRAIPDEILFNT